MRGRLIDGDESSYGIGLGPLTTLGAAVSLWARNLLPLTGFALVPAAAALAFEWATLSELGDSGTSPEDAQMFASSLAALLTFPLALGATAASYLLLDVRARGATADTGAIGFYGRGLKFFGRLFGVYFLMGLALIAPAVPALVLWRLDLIVAAIPLGAIAVCFAIWLFTRWSVAAPVAVLEDTTFSVAFARSRDLVRGAWWKAFGVMVLLATVEAIVAAVIWLIARGVVNLTDTEGPLISAISNFTLNVVTAPLEGAVLFALYAALNELELARGETDDD